MKAIFFGHSHIAAYSLAWNNEAVRPVISYTPTFAPIKPQNKWMKPIASYCSVKNKYIPNAAIMSMLEYHGAFADASSDPGFIVSVIGGNEHTIMSLLSKEQQVNFVMPGYADTPEETDNFVPFGAIHRAMQLRCASLTGLMKAIKKITSYRLICIESPPPPESNQWIINKLDPVFKARIEHDMKLKISRASVRWKFWKLRSMVIEDFCQKNKIEFLHVPDKMFSNGFLKNRYCSNATHANASYGTEMLKEVDKLVKCTSA